MTPFLRSKKKSGRNTSIYQQGAQNGVQKCKAFSNIVFHVAQLLLLLLFRGWNCCKTMVWAFEMVGGGQALGYCETMLWASWRVLVGARAR